MRIRSVAFEGSIVSVDQGFPSDCPHVAFAGRSNVGKSSLINRLLGRPRKKVARVSGVPGKTRALNFFRVNDAFFLVDLPGLGYARAPRPVREAWRTLIDGYFSGARALRGVVQLIDSRHAPLPVDRELCAKLAALEIPTLIVGTKIDRVRGAGGAARVEERIAKELLVDPDQIVITSSKTGRGTRRVLSAVQALVE